MKASKFIAQYTPRAHDPKERCGLCKHFIEPDGCKKVVGDISPKGWCRFFEREKE